MSKEALLSQLAKELELFVETKIVEGLKTIYPQALMPAVMSLADSIVAFMACDFEEKLSSELGGNVVAAIEVFESSVGIDNSNALELREMVKELMLVTDVLLGELCVNRINELLPGTNITLEDIAANSYLY